MRKEYTSFAKRMDWKAHFLSFMKCTESSCTHCSSHPVKTVHSIALMQESGGFFTPTPDELHPGHFQTCLQMVLRATVSKTQLSIPADAYLLSTSSQPVSQFTSSSCDCCKYSFTSLADAICHKHLADVGELFTKPQQHVCSFSTESGVCSLAFQSYHALTKHKTSAGHKCAKG